MRRWWRKFLIWAARRRRQRQWVTLQRHGVSWSELRENGSEQGVGEQEP